MELPEGTFVRDHAAARHEVIGRLHDLILTRPEVIRAAAGSAFSLADFLDQTEAARPFAARERCKILAWPAWARAAQPTLAWSPIAKPSVVSKTGTVPCGACSAQLYSPA